MKVISRNKKASFNYELIDKYEAGLVLTGSEIKSLRQGNISLQESYISFHGNEAFIINMNITNYKFNAAFTVDPLRKRKLLLNKKQIKKLEQEKKLQNLVVVPIMLYINDRGLAKLQIASARPKKLHDKRQSLKDKDLKRQIKKNY